MSRFLTGISHALGPKASKTLGAIWTAPQTAREGVFVQPGRLSRGGRGTPWRELDPSAAARASFASVRRTEI